MKRCACWLTLLAATGVTSVWAQPQIGYVYPAGGQQGTTLTVTVGGQSLQGAEDAHISGDGVSVSVNQYIRPLRNQELWKTAQFMRNIVKRRWSGAAGSAAAMREATEPPLVDHPWLRGMDEKSPRELERLWTSLFDPKQQPNAQIGEQVVLEIEIAPDAKPGAREFRLSTPAGLTNPMSFYVGALPEALEKDYVDSGNAAPPVADLPIVLNGQITPGEVDSYRIRAGQGQRLVIRMQARDLVPYLADAVPGWFQATMALYDESGAEVMYADDYRFDPDPVLLWEVPADGVYRLEVRDAIYRGRDDFVYRVTAGELPFVTSVYPLGGQVSQPTSAALTGWNLPTDTLALDTSPDGPAIRTASVPGTEGLCGPVRYEVGSAPEIEESEPNNAAEAASALDFAASPQVTVNGRVDAPGDVDVFRFEGRAGQAVVAEVVARRIGSPLDSALRLVGPDGALVAANDDHEDPTTGLVTHQADSYIQADLPSDGTYALTVADTQCKGGGPYAYRLHIGPPQPDFAVRLTPSSLNIAAGRSVTAEAHAVRMDGFTGDIDLALVNPPAGFALGKSRIPAGEDKAEITITTAPTGERRVVSLQLQAGAQIAGQMVTRPVVPAEDMMQAFLYRHLVPREELLASVTGANPVPIAWRPLVPGISLESPAPVHIALGGTAQVRVKAAEVLGDREQTPLDAVRFRLGNTPRGMTLVNTRVGPGAITFTVTADRYTALAGDTAYLVIEALALRDVAAPGEQNAVRRRHVSIGVLPAIPYQIDIP